MFGKSLPIALVVYSLMVAPSAALAAVATAVPDSTESATPVPTSTSVPPQATNTPVPVTEIPVSLSTDERTVYNLGAAYYGQFEIELSAITWEMVAVASYNDPAAAAQMRLLLAAIRNHYLRLIVDVNIAPYVWEIIIVHFKFYIYRIYTRLPIELRPFVYNFLLGLGGFPRGCVSRYYFNCAAICSSCCGLAVVGLKYWWAAPWWYWWSTYGVVVPYAAHPIGYLLGLLWLYYRNPRCVYESYFTYIVNYTVPDLLVFEGPVNTVVPLSIPR